MKEKDPELKSETTEQMPVSETPTPDTAPEQAQAETVPELPDTESELAQLRKYKEMNDADNAAIMDALDAEPVLAKIIQDIVNGATLRESLALHFDQEDFTAQEGDPDYEKWSANAKTRKEGLAKRKEWEDNWSKNQEMSVAEINEYAKETGKTPEQMIKLLEDADDLLKNLYSGLIDRKALAFIEKAINADQVAEAAREEGVIEGRNAKIEAQVMPEKTGDGLPVIQSSDTPDAPKPAKKMGYIERLNSQTT